MIGFQQELLGDQRQPDEPLETRNLEKRDLYELVASTYFLPPTSSKGVTRHYLLQVHKDAVFRVTKIELRRFEVELSSEMVRRVSNISNAILVRKLNLLLQKSRNKTLGFSESEVPDQSWLCRVARFIDRTNLTEFFEAHVSPEPPLHSSSSQVSKIHHGRMAASQWFFRDKSTKQNRKIWEAMKEISENYRTFVNHRINLEIQERELNELRIKKHQQQQVLEDLLSQAAITYTCIENPQLKPEMLLAGGEALTADMRDILSRNARIIKYIYCTDSIVDQNDTEALELTRISLTELGSTGAQVKKVIIPKKVDG